MAAPMEKQVPDKRRRWFELSLVLLISFGVHVLQSAGLLSGALNMPAVATTYSWPIALFHELTCLMLLGYVLSLRRLGFKDIGLQWSLGGLGVGIGVALVSYISYFIGYDVVHQLFHGGWPTLAFALPT